VILTSDFDQPSPSTPQVFCSCFDTMTQTREAAAQAAELHTVFMRHLPFFERVMLHYADSGSKGTALPLAALWRLAARCRLATPSRPLAALDRLALAARVQQLYPHPRARATASPHDPAAPLSLQAPRPAVPRRPPCHAPALAHLCASISRFFVVDAAPHCLS
jgi:hypothetical protein